MAESTKSKSQQSAPRAAPVLDGKQRRHLRSLAHSLQPILQIGKSGPSETLMKELDRALEAHELVKVRVLRECPTPLDEILELAERTLGLASVGTTGKVAVLYRRRAKDPRIALPGETAPSQPKKPKHPSKDFFAKKARREEPADPAPAPRWGRLGVGRDAPPWRRSTGPARTGTPVRRRASEGDSYTARDSHTPRDSFTGRTSSAKPGAGVKKTSPHSGGAQRSPADRGKRFGGPAGKPRQTAGGRSAKGSGRRGRSE